ncbi:sigma-54-dependent transcriptional regulator [Geofilum rhodophaeum]|uniref:sigma-54-dependent transcriptional regulator n=1 Tax=Geofilum rhodophaeum TaxID=1965019 RepID=UPI000B520EB5|nr:sigma-54 dependent transcriptional regulator [Geofilum rhodophaeum]
MNKLLIVEDDLAFSRILKGFLEKKGFTTNTASNLKEARNLLLENVYKHCLLDYRLPDGTGLELLQELRDKSPGLQIIIMTAFSDVRTVVKAMKMGASDYITKPVNPDELLMLLRNSTKEEQTEVPTPTAAPRPQQANPPSKYITGTSPRAQQLQEFISLVAPTDMSVIIQGESGTGKEYAARAIHNASARSQKPFVAIDCGVLSRDLAAGELFGYVKGAFTGALQDKKGQFEQASGGTLFLDEIGNLPYEVQVKLLRALQEKVIQPLGSDKLIRVDLRLLVATNDNLAESVAQGKFREDLYHRLNEFKIAVPPLRQRPEDLMLFIHHFISEANRDLKRGVEEIAPEALQLFEKYDWPGNLRELRNTIRRMVLLTPGKSAGLQALPEEMLSGLSTSHSTARVGSDLKALQELNEKEQIAKVLQEARGNKSKAARLLNIDRKTLYNKMEKYGLKDDGPE